MDAEEHDQAQDHHQQSHDVLLGRAGFTCLGYHFRGTNGNALKCASAAERVIPEWCDGPGPDQCWR
jgi:hypothetical protein